MRKVAFVALAAGSVILASCANYATKEYVDQQIAGVNQRVSSVDSKLANLEKEVAALKAQSAQNAGLADRVANLEAKVNEMKNTCPSTCSDRINALEKDLSAIKEKVEKQTKAMEKEVEKSMRK